MTNLFLTVGVSAGRASFFLAAFSPLLLSPAEGGTPVREPQVRVDPPSHFDRGRMELQSSTGAYFSVGHSDQPSLNYSSSAYRLGVMLDAPHGEGVLRGNWEPLFQLSYGSPFNGPGNYLFGGALLLRYNFVQPDTKWVPYVQVGVGANYSDISKDDRVQRLVGQAWEIEVHAAVGLRYLWNERWSVGLEGGYRYLSNVGRSDRDIGLNSLGFGVGLGYHF